MDFEPHAGTSDADLNLLNAEKASNDYVIERLFDSGYFQIVDKDTMHEKLGDLKITGIIDAKTAQEIGEILDVRYIIYGNVVSIVAEDNKVEALLMVRIMDVNDGKILNAAKGLGKAKVSKKLDFIVVRVNSVKTSKACIHESLQKAAYQATDMLLDRLFERK